MPKKITIKTILLNFLKANKCNGFTYGYCYCTIKGVETQASVCSSEDCNCEPYKTIAGSRMTLSDIEEYEKNAKIPKV